MQHGAAVPARPAAAGRDLVLPDAARAGLDGQVPPVADRPAVGRRPAWPARWRAGSSASSPTAAGGWSRRTCCRWSCRARARRSRSTGPRATCWRSSRRRPCYVTEPLAEVLGIEEVISTRFEIDERAVHRPPARPGLRRPRQGPLGRGSGGAPAARPDARAGSTRIRTPTCRCSSGSATRWSSTPIRACSGSRSGAAGRCRTGGSADVGGRRRRCARERLFGALVHAGRAAAAGPGAGGGRRPRRRDHARRSSTRRRRPRPRSSRASAPWSAGWASSRRCSRASTGARACA